MKLIFAGTPEFAATALDALLTAGHEIALVLTQPDRPSGRGLKTVVSPVKKMALAAQLRILQPASLKSDEAAAQIKAAAADAMVVAAYGLILPPAVLAAPRFGCINIHASLLPRWRGAAPIQRALLAGDSQTGVSIMQMDAGLDSGPVLLRQTVAIAARETAHSLHDKLGAAGARCIVDALPGIAAAQLQPQAQSEAGVTYAAKLLKSEATVDWRQSVATVDRAIRAFNPFPVARVRLHGTSLKLWRAEPVAAIGEGRLPGAVVQADQTGIIVACGDGAVRIEEVQRAGGKRLPAAAFLAGFPIQAGERFDVAGAC